MKNLRSAIIGLLATIGLATWASAEVGGVIALVNESDTPMCAVYFTTPEADFADSPELLSANNLDCIQPGEAAAIEYDGLSDCYAVVDIFDDVGEPLYSNGFELCNRGYIEVTDDDVVQAVETPEIQNGHWGYLQITNQSSQQICQVYFESLEGDTVEVYQTGDNGNCLSPDMMYTIEYDIIPETCEVWLTVETGFLDLLFEDVYDLCQGNQLTVSD